MEPEATATCERGSGEAKKAPFFEVERLPDDVMLLVLDWLSPADLLLRARHVCRRWAALVRHQSLWRARAVPDRCSFTPSYKHVWTHEGVRTLAAALQVLPCVGTLNQEGGLPLALLRLAADTHCSCEELVLDFRWGGRSADKPNLLVLRRQVELGLLRALTVLLPSTMGPRGAKLVARAIASVRVERLVVRIEDDWYWEGRSGTVLPAAKPLPGWPRAAPLALKAITFRRQYFDDQPLLTQLVGQSLDSLEDICIDLCTPHQSLGCLPLLAGCRALREAYLPMEPAAMVVLLAPSPPLRRVTLVLVGPVKHAAYGALPELPPRAGTQLHHLTMCVSDVDLPPEHELSLPLVRAISAAGGAQLVQLVANTGVPGEAVLALLPGLPQLQELVLHSMPAAGQLQLLVTPATAPNLHLLSAVRGLAQESYGGLHRRDQCWVPAMVQLLRANPQLHVAGLLHYHKQQEEEEERCQCCARMLGCPGSGPYITFGLHGHAAQQRCEWHAGKVSSSKWCKWLALLDSA